MRKVLKILLLVICAFALLLVVGLFAIGGVADYRNKHYWQYNTSDMPIESKYIKLGEYETDYVEYDVDGVCEKIEISFPKELKDGDGKYPLVVMANGTGTKASQYKEVFTHLASWGFIVVGNEDENCRTGESSSATLDYVLALNEDKESIFYGKIDTDNIGITGHSQGGVGAINAVTEQINGSRYKAVYSISATSRYHADELNKSTESGDATRGEGWSIDVSKGNIPIMMVAGTGTFDAGTMEEYSETLPEGKAQGICPLWWLEECYKTIDSGVTKVIARQMGKDHGDMLRSADGYMTVWFCYHLKGDTSADFFSGTNAEILSNANWQDVKN